MWVQHLSSLQFLTYVAFFAVVVAAICKFVPGKAAPVREEPYPDEELHAHDPKTAKYFVAGGFFLLLRRAGIVRQKLPPGPRHLSPTRHPGPPLPHPPHTPPMIVGGG